MEELSMGQCWAAIVWLHHFGLYWKYDANLKVMIRKSREERWVNPIRLYKIQARPVFLDLCLFYLCIGLERFYFCLWFVRWISLIEGLSHILNIRQLLLQSYPLLRKDGSVVSEPLDNHFGSRVVDL